MCSFLPVLMGLSRWCLSCWTRCQPNRQIKTRSVGAVKHADHCLHQNLRYKDYQLASRAAPVQRENAPDAQQMKRTTGLFESETVRDFGSQMQQRGVYAWWRQGMGFTGSEDRL
jgi:hypothetical protein